MVIYNCSKEIKKGDNKMKKSEAIIAVIAVLVIGGIIEFGIDALIVLAVCKIVGITFAWKWVFLLWIVMFLLSCLFRQARND